MTDEELKEFTANPSEMKAELHGNGIKFRINDGDWQTEPTIVKPGDVVEVQQGEI